VTTSFDYVKLTQQTTKTAPVLSQVPLKRWYVQAPSAARC